MELSYLLYVSVLIVCALLAHYADRRENKLYMWSIILILTLLAGLRDVSVGIDTESYLSKFEHISLGEFRYAYGLETSFKIICYVLLKLIPSTTFLLVAFAFLTNFCIIARMWELRRISSFSTMIACYYMAFFFATLNGMRQFCAIAIIFYGTRYLVKHQTIRYFLWVMIAVLFHQSAVLGLVLVAFDIVRWKRLHNSYKLVLFCGLLCSPVVLVFVLQKLGRYWKYLDYSSVKIGAMVPVKIGFFVFSLLFIFWIYGKNHHFINWKEYSIESKESVCLSCLCYTIGLALLFISYFIPIINRVSWYFTIYEGVFMGILTRTNNRFHRYFFTVCAWMIVGFGFVTAMLRNSQGTMPYLFVWQ